MSPTPTPAKDKDVVYLEVDDDITTIVDKLDSAKAKIVALVLPKRFATLQSIVNMRLLARSANAADKKIVLVTAEAALLPLAGVAGIHVAKNLQSAPQIPPSPLDGSAPKPEVPEDPDAEIDEANTKLDYHRAIGELASAGGEESEAIALEDDEDKATEIKAAKSPKDKKLKVPNFERFRLLLALGVLGVVALIVFIILAIFVLPKATITLQTEATPISANLNLTTSDSAKTLDENKGVIPAALKTSDFTSNQQVQATGQQNNGQKASGTVTIKNCTDGAVTVPAGTGVSTSGLVYITQKTLNLDSGNFDGHGNCKSSGSHVDDVDVVAQQGGSKYNVGSGQTFSVSGQSSGVTGSNDAAFSGGTDNVVTILSQADVESAKNKVTDQDKNNFANNFKKQLGDQGLYVLGTTLKAGDPVVNASPGVGQPASTASISIKITYSVLAVQKTDLTKAIADELNKQIDKSKQKIGTNDVLKDVSVNVQSQSSPTVAKLGVSEATTTVPIINTDVVKKMAEGQKAGDIKANLSNWPGVKNVDVKLSPFWVSKAPKKPGKIQVILQQVKSSTKP